LASRQDSQFYCMGLRDKLLLAREDLLACHSATMVYAHQSWLLAR
jgi:hypothetical protein